MLLNTFSVQMIKYLIGLFLKHKKKKEKKNTKSDIGFGIKANIANGFVDTLTKLGVRRSSNLRAITL